MAKSFDSQGKCLSREGAPQSALSIHEFFVERREFKGLEVDIVVRFTDENACILSTYVKRDGPTCSRVSDRDQVVRVLGTCLSRITASEHSQVSLR